MIETPRPPGLLTPSPAIVELLQTRGCARTTPRTLNLDRVREAESALGSHIPDDVLAIVMADIAALKAEFELSLGLFLGHTGALAETRAPGSLVAIGQRSREFITFEKTTQRGGELEIRIFDAIPRRVVKRMPLVDWLIAHTPEPANPPNDYAYELIASFPETANHGRRVRHAKFGEGRALKEIGNGPTRKVKVDFPGTGLKTLQARFLEFLDNTSSDE